MSEDCQLGALSHDYVAKRADDMIRIQRHTIPAIMLDKQLLEIDASEWWDDCFLTNIVIPYLEHIRWVLREDVANMIAEHPDRGTFDNDTLTKLVTEIESLRKVIQVCYEWRG